MNRRNALKTLGLGTGIAIATPTLISFLHSCSSETNIWQPLFLSREQANVLHAIVDVILPKTDTPSASEVNVPQFIDRYIYEVSELDEQENIKEAFNKLINLIKLEYNENINKVSEDQFKNLLDIHMLLKEPPIDKSEPMTVSNLLNTIKWMAINAYRMSEVIGETVLVYDPVPGASYCGDLNELTQGKCWSLKYGH